MTQRSYLAHEYFAIDTEEVWNSVTRDISDLKLQIQAIMTNPRAGLSD